MRFFQNHWVTIIFVCVSLLISTYYIDLWSNGNTSARVLPIVSYVDDGVMHIDKNEQLAHDKCFVNGHYYSDKAPLPTFVMIPIVSVLHKMGLLPTVDHSILSPELYAICGFLGSTLPFLGILLLTFFGLKKETTRTEPFLVLTLFLSSFIFIYAGTFFGHLFAAFLLLFSYVKFKEKNWLLSGFLLGLAFASEYTLGLIGFFWGIQLFFKWGWKKAALFSLGTLPGILFIMGYNYYYTGSPFDMLYKFVPPGYDFMKDSYGMRYPTLSSIWGLTFSPYRGILFYSPLLVLIAYFGLKKSTSFRLKDLLLHPLVIPTLASFLLISSYVMWWGGWSWGPRHLIAITVLFLYQGVITLRTSKIKLSIIYLFCFVGLILNTMAKVTIQYSVPTEVKSPVREVWTNNLAKGFCNPNNLATYCFHLSGPSAAILFLCLLVCGLGLLFFLPKFWRRLNQEY